MREIFGDLQNELEIQIKELKKEIDFENYKKIQNISHKIKGTFANFYCKETSDIMCEINDVSKEGNSYQSIQKYKGLNKKYIKFNIYFLSFVKNLNT